MQRTERILVVPMPKIKDHSGMSLAESGQHLYCVFCHEYARIDLNPSGYKDKRQLSGTCDTCSTLYTVTNGKTYIQPLKISKKLRHIIEDLAKEIK